MDDQDIVERLCPEIADLPVLKEFDDDEEPMFERKTNKITPRMLLSHTAGFPYKALDSRANRMLPEDYNELSGKVEDLAIPLLFQPGVDWVYGVSILRLHHHISL